MIRRPFFLVCLALAAGVSGCARESPPGYQGWVEADLLFIGPAEAGRVETLSVREGQTIEAGAQVFTLDSDLQRADVVQAEAALTNAKQALERAQTLLKNNAGTQRAFEDAEAAHRTAQARYNSAQTLMARRRVSSPAGGTIQQVYFRTGEYVTAARPVVSLLAPDRIKVRFFVSEAVLPAIAIGAPLKIACDGCQAGLTGKISFISRTAEFTPPVIYSQDERAKLVFLVEGRPDQPAQLRVGQPITVLLAGTQP